MSDQGDSMSAFRYRALRNDEQDQSAIYRKGRVQCWVSKLLVSTSQEKIRPFTLILEPVFMSSWCCSSVYSPKVSNHVRTLCPRPTNLRSVSSLGSKYLFRAQFATAEVTARYLGFPVLRCLAFCLETPRRCDWLVIVSSKPIESLWVCSRAMNPKWQYH